MSVREEKQAADQRMEQLLPPILAILDTALEGGVELLQRLYDGQLPAAAQLADDLRQGITAIRDAQKPIQEELKQGSTEELLENVEDTLDELAGTLKEDLILAMHLAEYQLLPFLRLARESFYFWGAVYPDPERMKRYYEEEFALHYQSPYYSPEQPARYRLSIVVPGYNHLETTRLCVENILKYADLQALDAELVLIDHGSSDGTLEFFRSVPGAKVIHFKRNVRLYMFAAIPLLCEGEYINYISNDILVTRHWAENLMACLDSDENIALASPLAPNVCNYQTPPVQIKDPEEFVRWADEFNRSDPGQWSDRARVMPAIGIFRSAALYQLGLADPYFYSMEFWDDDFSLRARRAGWRQVVCGDTACYHFGSTTGGEAQRKESTLEYGRELFRAKNGVDAWGTGFCYDYNGVRLLMQCAADRREVTALSVDSGFGDTPLQVRNELRRQGRTCRLYQITAQPEYAPDLRPWSDGFALAQGSLPAALRDQFPGERFDLIELERPLGRYENFRGLLQAAGERLAPRGALLFRVENPWCAWNLHALLQFTLPGSEPTAWVAPAQVKKAAEALFANVQVIPVRQDISGIDGFVKLHYPGQSEAHGEIREQLSVKEYYFVCRK